jgi:hypothetical protein
VTRLVCLYRKYFQLFASNLTLIDGRHICRDTLIGGRHICRFSDFIRDLRIVFGGFSDFRNFRDSGFDFAFGSLRVGGMWGGWE